MSWKTHYQSFWMRLNTCAALAHKTVLTVISESWCWIFFLLHQTALMNITPGSVSNLDETLPPFSSRTHPVLYVYWERLLISSPGWRDPCSAPQPSRPSSRKRSCSRWRDSPNLRQPEPEEQNQKSKRKSFPSSAFPKGLISPPEWGTRLHSLDRAFWMHWCLMGNAVHIYSKKEISFIRQMVFVTKFLNSNFCLVLLLFWTLFTSSYDDSS